MPCAPRHYTQSTKRYIITTVFRAACLSAPTRCDGCAMWPRKHDVRQRQHHARHTKTTHTVRVRYHQPDSCMHVAVALTPVPEVTTVSASLFGTCGPYTTEKK
jgi:hypothetical protein